MEHYNPYPADFVAIPHIPQDIRYATNNNFTGEILPGYIQPEALLRLPVAQALLDVQRSLLKENLSLLIYDAYRPQRSVDAIVRWANKTDPGLMANNYITDRSSHSRGIAVDLTLAHFTPVKELTPLHMGTPFDSFSKLSHTASTDIPLHCQTNRQKLVQAMAQQGFENYEKEWWHFTWVKEKVSPIFYDFPIR